MLRWRVHRKDDELMGFAKFTHQRFGGEAVRDFPAGNVISFTERGNDKCALGQRRKPRHALMWRAIEHHVLIDLIADEKNIGIAK